MAAPLTLFIDFDNVDPALRIAGPVALAKALVAAVPSDLSTTYPAIHARFYGGWRNAGLLTNAAQALIPDIRANAPTMLRVSHDGVAKVIRLSVELVDRPIGTMAMLGETFARERRIRKFRVRPLPWKQCLTPNSCGMASFTSLGHTTGCSAGACGMRLQDILVQDEQKMVDTLIVADIAYQTLIQKMLDVVVVSSDADIWPGILLAINSGCRVVHLHPSPGWRTPGHLLKTLDKRMQANYRQVSA